MKLANSRQNKKIKTNEKQSYYRKYNQKKTSKGSKGCPRNNSEKIKEILTLHTVFSLLNALGVYIFFLILGWASVGEGR